MDVQHLDWDTQFFGFGTARILPSSLNANQLAQLLAELRGKETRLVYWSTPEEVAFDISALNGWLVDRKTTFQIELETLNPQQFIATALVGRHQAGAGDEGLYNLAIQSGEYSRFACDPRFPQEKFRALYREWMRKCLSHELADEILVVGEAGKPSGMVTVSKKGAMGEIGLIAVDAAARGKHYGEMLVRAAQLWYLKQGLQQAQVVTQGDNLPACRLYRKCGYETQRVEYFYHFWL